MRKIIQPCGFHCIKINNLGVSFGEQTVLEDVNMHRTVAENLHS